MGNTVTSHLIFTFTFLCHVLSSEGAAVRRQTLRFSFHPPEGGGVVLPARSRGLRNTPEASFSSRHRQETSESNGHQRPPPPDFLPPIKGAPPKYFSAHHQGASKLSSSVSVGGDDIQSVQSLMLQVQGEKLDSILAGLGTLASKIPDLSSCNCDCDGGSGTGDDASRLPVTLEHLKANVAHLRTPVPQTRRLLSPSSPPCIPDYRSEF